MPILLNKTIRLFLDSIGRRDEYEFYLRKFAGDKTSVFALLCPRRNGFEEVSSVFTFDLNSLLRLELIPAVLLCGSSASEMQDMLCVGDHPYATCLLSGVDEEAGAGQAPEFLSRCKADGKVGLLLAPDYTEEQALMALVPSITRRIHIIRVKGPLRSENGGALYFYYTSRPNPLPVAEDDRSIVDMVRRILEKLPTTHISVASPWDLLEELFTVKGAGCVIRRGSLIRCVEKGGAVNVAPLKKLLEESFGKALQREDCITTADVIYLEDEYRGAALLEKHACGMYLSKFAVGTQARGEGLANEIWEEILKNHEALFWRALSENPINQWYEKRANGYHQAGKWKVFWRGIPEQRITEVVEYTLARAEDF